MQPSHHDPGFPSPRPVLFSSEPGDLSWRTCSWLPFQSFPSPCSCLEYFLHCCSRRQARCWHFSVPWGPFDLSALSCPPRSFFSVNNTQHLQFKALPLRVDVQNTLFWKQHKTHHYNLFWIGSMNLNLLLCGHLLWNTEKNEVLGNLTKKCPEIFPHLIQIGKEEKKERMKGRKNGGRERGRKERRTWQLFFISPWE